MNTKVIWGVVIAAALVAILFWAVDVDVTGDVELPTVDVSATGGELPNVDVETVDIDVVDEDVTVDVPTIEVNSDEKTFTIPTLEVTSPEENTTAEENDL